MSIKLLVLKSGEDIVADVEPMTVSIEGENKVIGYYLTKPCVVRMKDHTPIRDHETDENKQKGAFSIRFYPWIPLAKEPVIPLTTEWVVTMVDPLDKLTKLYEEQILNYGQDNQTDSTGEQRETDQ